MRPVCRGNICEAMDDMCARPAALPTHVFFICVYLACCSPFLPTITFQRDRYKLHYLFLSCFVKGFSNIATSYLPSFATRTPRRGTESAVDPTSVRIFESSFACERSSFHRESNTRPTTRGDPYLKCWWASGKSFVQKKACPRTKYESCRCSIRLASW